MLQEEHRLKLDSLRGQLDAAELEIDRLHASRIATTTPTASATVGVSVSPDLRDMNTAVDRVNDYPRELRGEERQSGEV